MALNIELLKSRLREATGNASQEMIAKNLNMTQGNVSKLLSGTQTPTLETVYHIAQAYDVSVDWLLGLSNQKDVRTVDGEATYESVVTNLCALARIGLIKIQEDEVSYTMALRDPLVKMLLNKGLTLSRTDKELFEGWKKHKLAMFKKCQLISDYGWGDQTVDFLAGEAGTNEANWMEVYSMAMAVEANVAEMMEGNPSPFEG